MTEKNSKYQYDVFLSFSSKDIGFAKSIQGQLEEKGLKVFFFKESLKQEISCYFDKAIDDALKKSKNFVLICSPNAMKSKWVELEYRTFYNQFHMKNPDERRFFILEGKDFHESLLEDTKKSLQRAKSIEEIIGFLIVKGDIKDREQQEKLKTESLEKGEYKKHLSLLIYLVLFSSMLLAIYIFFFESTPKKFYATNLSFMYGLLPATTSHTEFAESLNRAVLTGMNKAELNIRKSSINMDNTNDYINKFASIIFEPSLTKEEKADKIIAEMMVPANIDAIVSGLYIDMYDTEITIRPLIFIKKDKKIFMKNLQYKRSELFLQYPIKKEKFLYNKTEEEITLAVKALVLMCGTGKVKVNPLSFIYLKGFSFWEKKKHFLKENNDEVKLIDKAVIRGICQAHAIKNKNQKIIINSSNHSIPDTDANVHRLFQIILDLNLTGKEKAKRVINKMMNPNNVDIIVSGQYIDDAYSPLITVRPFIVVKSPRKILSKNLQFKKEDVVYIDPISKKKILRKGAYGEIAQAVQELLEQL